MDIIKSERECVVRPIWRPVAHSLGKKSDEVELGQTSERLHEYLAFDTVQLNRSSRVLGVFSVSARVFRYSLGTTKYSPW